MAKETADGSMSPEEKLNDRLTKLADAGMEITARWTSMWQQSLRYFFSDQLSGQKTRKNWDWVIVNYIWPSAMNEIAKLSKNHPKIIANPFEVSDTEAAEVWQSHGQWQWESGINNGKGMRLEQMAAILDGKLFGYRVSKIYWDDRCYWDEQAQDWVGDVKHKLWHPAHFWADDSECIDDGNCGTDRYVTVEWAVDKWPQYEKEIRDAATKFPDQMSGSIYDQIKGQPSTTSSQGYGGQDTGASSALKSNELVQLITEQDSTGGVSDTQKEVVEIQEFYLKDYEEVNEKVEEDVPPEELLASGAVFQDEEGGFYDTETSMPMAPDSWPKRTVREYERPKFPNGRYVIRIGDTVLNPDEADQIWAYSRWPFVVTPHYLLPHMWQGVDAVQMYKSTQDMINVSVSHMFNNLKMFGDPKIAVETGALEVDKKTKRPFSIGAGAGAVIRLVRGALGKKQFQILPPMQMGSSEMQMYSIFTQEYKNIQGLQSIARGEKMPGKMSATEAQWLATSSVDRIALQTVYEDSWVTGCARLIAEICQDRYTVDRWVRIVGEDKIVGSQQITDKLKSVKFDINVVPGMTMPFDEEKRLQKYLQAYQLLQEPTANPLLPDVLRELGVMNWQKVLQQHQVYQEFMQFMHLYGAVREGKATPQEAMKIIAQKFMQLYAQQEGNPLTRSDSGKEQAGAAKQTPS